MKTMSRFESAVNYRPSLYFSPQERTVAIKKKDAKLHWTTLNVVILCYLKTHHMMRKVNVEKQVVMEMNPFCSPTPEQPKVCHEKKQAIHAMQYAKYPKKSSTSAKMGIEMIRIITMKEFTDH